MFPTFHQSFGFLSPDITHVCDSVSFILHVRHAWESWPCICPGLIALLDYLTVYNWEEFRDQRDLLQLIASM